MSCNHRKIGGRRYIDPGLLIVDLDQNAVGNPVTGVKGTFQNIVIPGNETTVLLDFIVTDGDNVEIRNRSEQAPGGCEDSSRFTWTHHCLSNFGR